jgi:LysR family hydrogen peroxide-inducible transcriptional activator
MTSLTMRHLRYFDALARHGHFGRAAEDCAISQPALSMQIKELEDILGAPLVERGGRAIHLTDLGEVVAGRVQDILKAAEELETFARTRGLRRLARLRLGMIPTVAPYLLPAVMTALLDRFPGLDLRPREAVTQTLLDSLHDGRLDAAVVALPVSEPGLEELALFSEEFVLVRPVEDAGQPVPSAEGLRAMRLLLLEEGHCFRDQALAFCAPAPPAPRDLMEGSSLSTLVRMVGAGIGVTLLPEMAVPVETLTARITVQRLREPRPRRTIGMVWRRSVPMAGPLREVAAVVLEVAEAARPQLPD